MVGRCGQLARKGAFWRGRGPPGWCQNDGLTDVDVRIETSELSGPIGVLSKEADTARNEEVNPRFGVRQHISRGVASA